MKSPFPGMDPYIEEGRLFEDFHQNLIDQIAHALAKELPRRYLVRKGERPYVVLTEESGPRKHAFKPDIGIVAPSHTPPSPAKTIGITEVDTEGESVSMQAFITEEYCESFIEIYIAEPNRELVTCIEVLSPSNKRRGTEGWDQYLRKRRGLLQGAANFVEIDLLRNGERLPMVTPWPSSPYALLVSRRHSAPMCRVWPGHFTRPLPKIPVPLLQPDPDACLELQPMIESIYTEFQYDRDIDYTRSLSPPLGESDAQWFAAQLLQQTEQGPIP